MSIIFEKPFYRLKEHWVLLVGLALLTTICLRIQTYVCSQDPANYIQLAVNLLRAPWNSKEFLETLLTISPMSPVIYALSIRVFGTFAPYWVNFCFGIVFLSAYYLLLRRILDDQLKVAAVFFSGLAVLIYGQSGNMLYLLQPYREMPSFAFAFMGLYLVLEAEARGRLWLFVLAGTSILLAAASREPTVLVAAGPLIWIATCTPSDKRNRFLKITGFLAPIIAALLVMVVLAMLLGRYGTWQMQGWLHEIGSRGSLGITLKLMFMQTIEIARIIWRAVGWPGLIFFGLGFVEYRKYPAILCFFLPAVLLTWIFYSLYLIYPRYLLSILVFLAPLIGMGWLPLFNWIVIILNRLRIGRLGYVMQWLVVVILVVVNMFGALQINTPAYFSLKNIRSFKKAIQKTTLAHGVIFTESRNRDARAAISAHTQLELGSLPLVKSYIANARPIYFLKPLNAECFSESRVRFERCSIENYLQDYGDLNQLQFSNNDSDQIVIGSGKYSLMQLVPWSSTNVFEKAKLPRTSPIALWLDFRSITNTAPIKVQISTSEGEQSSSWTLQKDLQGMHAFILPPGVSPAKRVTLRIESTEPLPQTMSPRWQIEGRTMKFSFRFSSIKSLDRWFKPPFLVQEGAGYYVGFVQGGRLQIPEPIGNEYDSIEITLSIANRKPRPGAKLITISKDGRVLSSQKINLEDKTIGCGVQVPKSVITGDIVLDLQVEPVEEGRDLFIIQQLNIAVKRS